MKRLICFFLGHLWGDYKYGPESIVRYGYYYTCHRCGKKGWSRWPLCKDYEKTEVIKTP